MSTKANVFSAVGTFIIVTPILYAGLTGTSTETIPTGVYIAATIIGVAVVTASIIYQIREKKQGNSSHK